MGVSHRTQCFVWLLALSMLLASCRSMRIRRDSPKERVLLVYLEASAPQPGAVPVTLSSTQEPVYLQEPPVLTRRDFQTAQLGQDPFGDEVIHIQLGTKAAKRLREITSEHLNERMVFVHRGNAVSAPRILMPILDGNVMISGHESTLHRILKEFDSR